jgi:pimeloyl-ACP methyl ester carboxylesterase
MTSDRLISCRWGTAFVRVWNEHLEGTPIVALHGWLDNCQSFANLAPLLNLPVYTIDLPGHGKSSHNPPESWYHFIDYVEKCRQVFQGLEISGFTLLGHSMGAAISILYAATFPESVNKLILLDGLGPLVNHAKESPELLKNAILEREKRINRSIRIYETIEQAVDARMTAGKLERKSAELLVQHHITETADSFKWTYDNKLTSFSAQRLTPEQLEYFYKNVNCPTLLIEAENGIIKHYPFKHLANNITKLTITQLVGHHHFHMDTPVPVAQEILKFL